MENHGRTIRALLVVFCAASRAGAGGDVGAFAAGDLSQDLSLRWPVAIEAAGSVLWVANSRSGSVSVLDAERAEVLVERPCGRRLSDLALLEGGRFLLATDEADDRLVLLERAGRDVRVVERIAVPHTPVSVHAIVGSRAAATPSGGPTASLATVASLWAWQLTFVHVEAVGAGAPRIVRLETLDLPFAPRLQCSTPDGELLLVAASFGGELAVVDVGRRALIDVRSIEAHNIRGLAVGANGDDLLIAHQQTNPNVPSEHARVFWGAMVTNLLRTVSIARLREESPAYEPSRAVRPITRWRLLPLGEPSRGAGDPAAVRVAPGGETLVAAAGVDELLVVSATRDAIRRIAVGDRPAAIALAAGGRRAFVASTFSDSVDVVDIASGERIAAIALGRQRGEAAFRDARLSLDGWVSCHSCHTDGHTNGLLNDNFGDGTFGTPKKVPTLHGAGPTGPWGWAGRMITLDDQIARSIETTMRRPQPPSEDTVTALIGFVGGLDPVPSVLAARGRIDDVRVAAGGRVFAEQGCERCHEPPLFATPSVFRVGLRDEVGRDRFNPPSLLGVSQRRGVGYFHDGRASSLREIFEVQRHPRGEALPAEELEDLLYFLESR